jgi:hypothetical protein
MGREIESRQGMGRLEDFIKKIIQERDSIMRMAITWDLI